MGENGAHNVLTEKQMQYAVARMAKPGSQIIGYDVKPASDKLAGFLGDHLRMILCVTENNVVRKIYLFIKTVPTGNIPKADFINQNQFFKKEAMVFQLLEQIPDVDCLNPWCTRAVIHNEKIIVMPDLAILGYRTHPTEMYFDRNHVFVVVSSLARFHAAFANYFTKRNQTHPHFIEEHAFFNEEPFSDAPWLKGAAKVNYQVLKEFSSKSIHYPIDLEEKLSQLYIKAYQSLRNNEDTLNVVIHKDLWANNILFQYNDNVPINAVLVDFQLARYAPPTFDLMSLLYMTTSRQFRDCYENEVFHHYYKVFSESLDDCTKQRLQNLNYDFAEFLKWCERSRMFGLVQANTTIPCVCMEPDVAQKTFDDPDTYVEHVTGDRSKPVVAHSRENVQYRLRQLEVSEEFVEKYVCEM
ncbi:uncharacterized protein LOC120629003 [Pararge aegeria]|uniref:Jg1574 protein n=1 Tax=Pararge aegeria aegeria TaxID=348720 RepID=A0A8S4RD00_9NEOP|nr:uncharacterized protein LOC120629003 [Pararge aegeria]CAH2233623.1 jg1574 [Pararge aegeria aegeria]